MGHLVGGYRWCGRTAGGKCPEGGRGGHWGGGRGCWQGRRWGKPLPLTKLGGYTRRSKICGGEAGGDTPGSGVSDALPGLL